MEVKKKIRKNKDSFHFPNSSIVNMLAVGKSVKTPGLKTISPSSLENA